MMTHPTERLSEYLDGELGPDERAEVEAHLGQCEACRQVMAELRGVVARAGSLRDRDPVTPLWPGIAEAIGATSGAHAVPIGARRGRKRFSFSLPQLLAAAASLVLVAGGTVWLGMSLRGSGIETPGPDAGLGVAPPAPAAQSVLFDPRGRADSAIAELERILAERRETLDTATIRILTHSLTTIDRAITQAREALAKDPSDPYLNDHLARTMRRKIDVLQRAAGLAPARS